MLVSITLIPDPQCVGGCGACWDYFYSNLFSFSLYYPMAVASEINSIQIFSVLVSIIPWPWHRSLTIEVIMHRLAYIPKPYNRSNSTVVLYYFLRQSGNFSSFACWTSLILSSLWSIKENTKWSSTLTTSIHSLKLSIHNQTRTHARMNCIKYYA